MEEVDKIIDCPTFKSCNKVIKALETNCILIEDERSDLGKLHCIIDSLNMEEDGVGVVASINPGPLSYEGLADTQAAKDTYLIGYYAQKKLWVADKNLKEAAKRFFMSRIDPTYFQELAYGVTGYKAVSMEDLIYFLQEEYPPEPEEIMEQQQSLLTEWDTNNHIHDLFDSVKLGVETLLEMGAIESEDCDTTCVHYIYNVIRKTGQFDPACFKWKALPPDKRATLQQIKTYFGDKYKVYDAQRLSLHQAGVANSVQLQEEQQATRDEIRTFKENQAAFNTAIIHMVQDKTD
jgi:hypothetical protein